MSKIRKPESQRTQASATELDELELSQVEGGGTGSFKSVDGLSTKLELTRKTERGLATKDLATDASGVSLKDVTKSGGGNDI